MRYLRILLAIVFFSCSALEGEQKTNVNDIIKSQEIKRVTHAEIMVHAEKMGSQIVTEISKLKSASDTCQFYNIISSDSVKKAMNIEINLGFEISSFKSETEQQLFEAYVYNLSNGIQSTNSIQSIDEENILFTMPFILEDRVSKKCLPDSTTSFGMWSVLIPIKSVVNNL